MLCGVGLQVMSDFTTFVGAHRLFAFDSPNFRSLALANAIHKDIYCSLKIAQ